MVVVACSGFPIAVSRYLAEFRAVEIADTEIGIPGMGSIRRWQREAPDGFLFSVLAPAAIGGTGFAQTGEVDQALKAILSFSKKLEAMALVFRVPEEVPFAKPVAMRAKKMLSNLPAGAPAAVVDAPHWPDKELAKLCESADAIAAMDPTKASKAPSGKLAYLALAGPAGYRSRYDEDTLASVADLCRRSTAETTLCVFRNIDREANAKWLLERCAAKKK
jgi:uncharacterized protein YecE (DUF72 family)